MKCASNAASAVGKETILLVEDEAQVRRLAAWILVIRGYQVLQASTAEEARSLFEGHNSGFCSHLDIPTMRSCDPSFSIITWRWQQNCSPATRC